MLGLFSGGRPYLHPDIVFTTKVFDAVATFSCATCDKIVYTVSLSDPRDRSQHWRLSDILGSYCPITRQRSDDWNVMTVTGRPCGSVTQWSKCSHDMREVLGSSPGRAMCFFLPCYIWWLSLGPCSGCEQQRTVSSVPAWFRADSGTNLIKQREIVTGRPCGSVAQWSECSHGLRKVLGSSPGRAMCFFLPCDMTTRPNQIDLSAASSESLNFLDK